jgi:hypothetical protein
MNSGSPSSISESTRVRSLVSSTRTEPVGILGGVFFFFEGEDFEFEGGFEEGGGLAGGVDVVAVMGISYRMGRILATNSFFAYAKGVRLKMSRSLLGDS